MTNLRVDAYVGDFGFKLYHKAIDKRTGLPADLSAGIVVFRVFKPNGELDSIAGGFETDGKDGETYFIPSAEFFDIPGRWRFETVLSTPASRDTVDEFEVFVGSSLVVDVATPNPNATPLVLETQSISPVAGVPLVVTSGFLTGVYSAIVQTELGAGSGIWDSVDATIVIGPTGSLQVTVTLDTVGALPYRVVLFGTSGIQVGLNSEAVEIISFVPVADDTVTIEATPSILDSISSVEVQRDPDGGGSWEVIDVAIEVEGTSAHISFNTVLPGTYRAVIFGSPAP